jgi:hypothetical protein
MLIDLCIGFDHWLPPCNFVCANSEPPSGRAEEPFYCVGFGSEAAKTNTKEGTFLATAGEKSHCGVSNRADRVRRVNRRG